MKGETGGMVSLSIGLSGPWGPLDDTNATRERAETRDGHLLCLVKPKRVDETGEVLCDCLVGVDGQQTEEVVA